METYWAVPNRDFGMIASAMVLIAIYFTTRQARNSAIELPMDLRRYLNEHPCMGWLLTTIGGLACYDMLRFVRSLDSLAGGPGDLIDSPVNQVQIRNPFLKLR